MRFADRMQHIKASGIREFFDKGRRIPDSIDLSIGQAHFDVPEAVKQATVDAIRGQCGRYSVTQGYPELVDATRDHLRTRFGLSDSDAVMMTTGAAGALFLSMSALVGPGDEVLVPDPFFLLYEVQIQMVGATPVFYDLHPDWKVRAEAIESKISDRTRVLILNSPSNPTGRSLSLGEVETVAGICGRRGIFVVSDELYDVFCYDEAHASIKRFPGVPSLLVGGFSKTYGMPGWRLGWAAGPVELIDTMRTLQQFTFVCPPTLVQQGALAGFSVDMTPFVDEYRARRDRIFGALVEAGYEVEKPGGSFYIYPRVPWGDDLRFCERALSEKLIIVPGRNFSSRRTHFRASFAVDDRTLDRAIEVFARLARG